MRRPRGPVAATARCPGCGARTYTQWVGRVAALHTTVDTQPINPADETRLRTRHRLTWCLITGQWRPPELRWRCTTRTCHHQVVIEHRCLPAAPTTLF